MIFLILLELPHSLVTMMVHFLGLLLGVTLACAHPSNPIYPAKPLLGPVVNHTSHGHLYEIDHEGILLKVLHVYGSPAQMGRASGELIGAFAREFVMEAMPPFYAAALAGGIGPDGDFDASSLPADVQDQLANASASKDEATMAAAMGVALDWVFEAEQPFIAASRSQPLVEMEAYAEGICASFGGCGDDGTLAAAILKGVQHVNMVGELIKMTCTMMGAWGKATPTDVGLVQLRALDVGAAPFANFSLLTVYHPDEGHAFASLGFPGNVGSVTGWSAQIGVSEKVWETYERPSVQPGHYDGEPVTGVIRDMLQFSGSKEEAATFAEGITRTWAVFLGVGDSSGEFEALAYREADLKVYTPGNVTEITHMPVMEDLVYIDKHPQPSHDNVTMPALMARYYGNITAVNTIEATREMATGDLHITVYDFDAKKAYLALGTIDATCSYVTKACDRPYLEFDFNDLFDEPLAHSLV